MPTTVSQLFAAAGLEPTGVVRWGTPIPIAAPGVYAVSVTDDAYGLDAAVANCPLSVTALQELLTVRPELRIDGQRPDAEALRARLALSWLPDEVIAYVGLAGTSLTRRVGDYYTTPLGARRPHAGGWPLKTLANLSQLAVFYAPCNDVDSAERAMLSAFITNVSSTTRAALGDPELPLPFANLVLPGGPRKRHGITGAREPAGATSRTTEWSRAKG